MIHGHKLGYKFKVSYLFAIYFIPILGSVELLLCMYVCIYIYIYIYLNIFLGKASLQVEPGV